RLGLPADGPGSIAGFGARLGAFVVDAIIANLLVGVPYLFGVRYSSDGRGFAILLAFLLEEFVLVSVAGSTIGMRLFGIRVVRAAGGHQTWPWVGVRTLLLALLVPVFIWDRDQRGTHDRAAGTVMIRDR
ncbi:MAG: RDD family protein, partial [Frankia sp.]